MLAKIRFYQIPWSHYCEKVRWALDIKGLPYETINYNPWGKTRGLEKVPKAMRRLFPVIEDPNVDEMIRFQCDSTPILLYLDEKYPTSNGPLFPAENELRQKVIDTCLKLDSELGLYARRITYAQILIEKPSAMSILIGEKYRWGYNPDDIRSRLISPLISAFMIGRYRMHRIREDKLREKLEAFLLDSVKHLQSHDYLVGNRFTAADLTFCSLVKPLTRVPCFSDDQRFRLIFTYYDRIRRQNDPRYPDIVNLAEKIADDHRIRTKQNEHKLINRFSAFLSRINFVRAAFVWCMQTVVNNVYGPETDYVDSSEYMKRQSNGESSEKIAKNDQQAIAGKSRLSIAKYFFKYLCHYFFTIPQQKAYLEVRR